MISHHDALTSLYAHAKDHMTADELGQLGDSLTTEAIGLARRMNGVAQNIACLVSEDGLRKTGAGNFQDSESVFELLCVMAHQFDVISGMVEVGSQAAWKANEIERKSR